MNKDKFWGFYENENYKVGCTGGSVYVFDNDENEIARFKGLNYAYRAQFMPKKNILVVKTTGGMLLIYDLNILQLIKRITISSVRGQDEGFAFSPDGKWLYNIESPGKSNFVQLTKYNTDGFVVEKIINKESKRITLNCIEFTKTGRCYLLGCTRDVKFSYDYGFVAELVDDEIEIVKKISLDELLHVCGYKSLEESGFTKKAYEVWGEEAKNPVSLEDIVENGWTLK